MENEPNIEFLFDITKEIKHFYESPVIFVTKKDYSDKVFNTMCNIRKTLEVTSKSSLNDTIDHIVDIHLEWLHAVNDIENYKKRITDLPREEVYQAISYTIDAVSYRLKYYKRYMEKNRPLLSNTQIANLVADMEIVEDMHKETTHMLLEKLKCFRNFFDNEEFAIKLTCETEELLNWLDKINDGLSMQISKYINLNVPQLTVNLTKTLQQIVDELQSSESPSAQKLLENLKKKGKELSSMIRCTADRSLEISKVVDKIYVLEDRIRRLGDEPTSAAVMALEHKKKYLEKGLASLENLKTGLKTLNQQADEHFQDVPEEELCICEDFFQLRIFNHSLPQEERERLVTQLCYLWDMAVFGDKSHKSIISILSAAEMKQEFSDELGTFYIDEYSRKVYKLPDDDTNYQVNENDELVPIRDELGKIYYYDDCGRYYIDEKTRQRVYKAHATASEYMMGSSGILLKIKEERDGVTYYYDCYGRYYINSEGKNIYREEDTISEYENNGLGNLVRIRSHLDMFDLCSEDVNVTEDFNYLKQTVGSALRVSIADAIMQRPADPVKFLSTRLVKFRETIELNEKRAAETESLYAEREFRLAEERAAAERAAKEAELLLQGGSEASYDSNLLNYSHEGSTAVTPVGPRTSPE